MVYRRVFHPCITMHDPNNGVTTVKCLARFERVACEQWTRNAHSNQDRFFSRAYGWDMALE